MKDSIRKQLDLGNIVLLSNLGVLSGSLWVDTSVVDTDLVHPCLQHGNFSLAPNRHVFILWLAVSPGLSHSNCLPLTAS